MKFPDWHARLIELIQARREEPFAWGSNDCCMWAADAVKVMTGRDPAEDLRGRYRSASGAARVLARLGGIASAGARCGEEVPRLCAQVGDIGLVSSDGTREALAVCIGEHWLAVVKNGLGLIDLDRVLKTWRVA